MAANLVATKVPLPRRLPSVLGVGAFLKNTLCLIQESEAWISHDNGSLDHIVALENYERAAADLLKMAKEKPVVLAHDLHPDFHSTRFVLNSILPTRGIQHHHAHIAAIMAEHGVETPTLGLALDGFGLGLRNESWGGELLLVDCHGFQRLGHLELLLQPGGDVAARQPWRMGAAALWALGRGNEITLRYKDFPQAAKLVSIMERGINCPTTSSAGRLFDAACGLLGVKLMTDFEGEAPTALEAMVQQVKVDPVGWKLEEIDLMPTHNPAKAGSQRSHLILDLRPLLDQLVGMEAQQGAELFHGTFIAALAAWVEKAAEKTGIRNVALGGGCFFNKVLREGLCAKLISGQLTPLLPRQLTPGDSAISLGQAWAAALSLETE